jgi:3-oxoacyl-[acyl-carrier protein] reductase
MVPDNTPQGVLDNMLQPEIMVSPAVFLASDASQSLTGPRLIATEWNQSTPEGKAVADGISAMG